MTRPRDRPQAGFAAVELVLMAPLLLVVMVFVVGLGRMAHARQDVNAAAGVAARAASLHASVPAASAAAHTAAARSLTDAGVECEHITVAVDVSGYRPGGAVTVTVACTADLSDVAVPGLPGQQRFKSTSSAPVETYRDIGWR